MAKRKRSEQTEEPTSRSRIPRKRRQSSPQSQTPHKKPPPLHYEIDTEYGRLVCDYDLSTELATDEQGNDIAAIIKAIRDRFDNDLDTSPKHPEFASRVKALAQEKGTTYEQAEEELRSRHEISHSLQTSAAWHEFTNGLGLAIENAMSQHFEMAIAIAKIQAGGLEPTIRDVAGKIIDLVKQQIKRRLKSLHISGGPLIRLSLHYYTCLPAWQVAKSIYRQNRDSNSWRKDIKDAYPHLPDDLIEWLAISDKRSSVRAKAFLQLPNDARHLLELRMKEETYCLSEPSEIALEHAARLCHCKPYSHSLSRLNNIKSEQSEETERTGVFHYLKNTKSIPSRQSDKTDK